MNSEKESGDYEERKMKRKIVSYHDKELDEIFNTLNGLRASDRFKGSMKQDLFDMLERKVKWTNRVVRTACIALVLCVISVIVVTKGETGARYMDFIREYLIGEFI